MASPPRVLICDDAAGFRLLTRTVLAAYEGLLFGFGLILGLTRRLR